MSPLALAQERRYEIPVELGRPSEWTRGQYEDPITLEWVPRPVARTAVDGIAVLFDGESPVGAVRRFCPHRQADLTQHGRPGSCPGQIACRHAGYEWDASDGDLVRHGHTGPAAPMEVWPIEFRDDGVVVAYLPSS